MMTGWLIVNGFLHSGKFDELADMFCEAAAGCGIRLQIIKNQDHLVDIGGPEKRNGGLWPDFVIFWDKDVLLAEYIESFGIPVYNSSHAIAVCDDKRKTHLALSKAGLPMPRTIFSPMTYHNIGYPDRTFLRRIETVLSYPMVIKEAYGSFGQQVYLAEDHADLEQIMDRASACELLFQEYVSASRGRDIRLQVVGDRVIGSMYRYSDKDFRANITAGGHMRMYEPSREECSLALRVARAVGADFAGVDLLFGEQGSLICEVNSNAHFKNLYECSGINTAEEILHYVKERRR